MADNDSDYLAEIKHYMRPSAEAEDKEIVTEKVHEGSLSFGFVQRMEALRLKKECLLSLDMRGKVPYECRNYTFRNRSFWLDDVSYEQFTRGLKENGGVFTMGLYEQIVSGNHTHKGIEQTRKLLDEEDFAKTGSGDVVIADAKSPYQFDSPQPDMFRFGLFRNRQDERLQITTEVSVSFYDRVIPLKTFDISCKGLQLFSRHLVEIGADENVLVSFTGFNEELGAGLENIQYKVVSSHIYKNDFRITLVCTDPEHEKVERFLSGFIAGQLKMARGRRRLDHEGEIHTAQSLLSELYYCSSTAVVPFFVRADGEKILGSTVCLNPGSTRGVCRDEDCEPILNALLNSHNLSVFTNHCGSSSRADPLVMIYMDNGKPVSACDMDFETEQEWLSFVAGKISDAGTRIYRVMLRDAEMPSEDKRDYKIIRLQERSPDDAVALLEELGKMRVSGVFADITRQVRQYDFERIGAGRDGNITDHMVEKHQSGEGACDLQVTELNYAESRSEERYIVKIEVVIKAGSGKIKAETVDLSVKGFSISMNPGKADLSAGDLVKVSFPGLEKKAQRTVKLRDVLYEVANKVENNGRVVYGFERMRVALRDKQTDFFRGLIERNLDKLDLDRMDSVSAGRARMYSAWITENVMTLPVFLRHVQGDNDRKLSVALPRKPGDLAAFFEVSPGKYDFSPLTVPDRVVTLSAELRGNQAASLVIYMYRKRRSDGRGYELFSATEDDFEDDHARQSFLDEALLRDHCVIKLQMNRVSAPSVPDVHQALERLSNRSPQHASRLRQYFEQITAVGDVIDITREGMAASQYGTIY